MAALLNPNILTTTLKVSRQNTALEDRLSDFRGWGGNQDPAVVLFTRNLNIDRQVESK